MKLVLGSKSPRRIDFLKKLNLNFRSIGIDKDEPQFEKNETPSEFVRMVTDFKIKGLLSYCKKDELLLCSDTIVAFESEVLGKPKNSAEASSMLQSLSAREHLVMTHFILSTASGEYLMDTQETTMVKFRDLRDKDIENYINTGDCFDKAGAYGIQSGGGILVEKLEGCLNNVIGFPVSRFLKTCENLWGADWRKQFQ